MDCHRYPAGANFTGANLTGADLSGINKLDMEGTDFTNAIICNTKWIDGTMYDDNYT